MKSISKNYIYNLFYQILTLILPLITTPYLSRVLGAENIGIYSYTASIATYFALFGTLGIYMYGQREVAYVQNDKYKGTLIFWEIVILRFITMAISIISFIFTFAYQGNYSIYYRILIIELLSQCLDISWYFQGLEEFKKTVVRNSIVKLISIICIFIFVKTPDDLIKYVFIMCLSNFIGNFSLWLYLPKYLTKIKFKELNVKKHVKPTIQFFIPQISIQIYTVLDRTMIGEIIEDKSEVGFYEQAQKVVKLLLTIVTSLGTVMVPRMANVFAQGDTEQLKKYMYNSFKFVFTLAFPMIAGLVLVSNEFVPLFFGEGFDKVALLINVISPILLFIGMSNIIGVQYLLSTKKQREFTISVTVGAICNFIFNFIAIPKIGALGASIATVFAEFVVVAIQLYFIRKSIEIKKLFSLLRNNLIATVLMFIITYITSLIIHQNGIISIIISVIEGCIIYGVTLILLKDEFLFTIKDKIFKSRRVNV